MIFVYYYDKKVLNYLIFIHPLAPHKTQILKQQSIIDKQPSFTHYYGG